MSRNCPTTDQKCEKRPRQSSRCKSAFSTFSLLRSVLSINLSAQSQERSSTAAFRISISSRHTRICQAPCPTKRISNNRLGSAAPTDVQMFTTDTPDAVSSRDEGKTNAATIGSGMGGCPFLLSVVVADIVWRPSVNIIPPWAPLPPRLT